MKNILYITKEPVNSPWNEANKNLAYLIASSIKDYKATLLTSHSPNIGEKVSNIDTIEVYTKKSFEFYQQLKVVFWLFTTRHNIDLIHSFIAPRLITSRLLNLAALRQNARLIQTIPSLGDLKQLGSSIFRFADALVAMSEYTQSYIQKLGFKNVSLIYPGIDLDFFSRHIQSNNLAKRLEISSGTPVVVYAGEYTRLESFDNLLSWMPEVAKKVPGVKFIIATRIKWKREYRIEKIIKKKIADLKLLKQTLFVGNVENMQELHDLATINVFPAKRMSGKFDLPMVLLEAMASGCPIVTSNEPPLDELFKGDIGFSIDYGNTKKWADIIVNLLKDPKKCKQMGNEGKKVVKEWFDIKNIAGQYQKLYGEVL